MGRTYNQLDERLQGWIADQRMFFVATAPGAYRTHRDHKSIDGLPALPLAASARQAGSG